VGSSIRWTLSKEYGIHVLSIDVRCNQPSEGIRGSIADPKVWDVVYAMGCPELIIHCAGLIVVSESVREPHRYYAENVVAALGMLEHIRRRGPVPIVFSSSAAVYGHPTSVPISEDAPKAPINPYGQTKWMFEQILADYHRAYGLPWIALRYFNAAGVVGTVREAHQPETHLLPLAAGALARGEAPIIYGHHYPTRDGTAIRDFIHVADLAEAHLLAGEYLLDGGEPTALNLGSGHGVTVLEAVAALQKASGRYLSPRFDDPRPGDPPELVASINKARQLLGWTPRRSDIERIAREVWETVQ
jgi:UDP-glucose 4-epimerase